MADDSTSPSGGGFMADRVSAMSSAAKGLGTLSGVFLPTVQNITGVLLFLRLPWITGQAGILLSLAIVACSIGTTIPTALSMSAIATNGRIPAGGPYYVVSRNLGAPFGAAIGFLFYLGTSLAATMYVLGAVEAFQTGFNVPTLFPMDREVIALAVMLVLALVVYVGVQWVSRTMYVFLSVVVVSIVLGLGGLIAYRSGASFGSTDTVLPASSPLWTSTFTADPDSGLTPSFQSLLAIFYPSVTGIMAGSNRSGLLRDPSASIPVGTLGAIAITSVLYFLTIGLFGSFVDVATLKANKLVFASVAWPVRDVVTVGVVASSVGAALQCLTGAPQLLATMLADDVLPFVPAAQNLASAVAGCLCGRGRRSRAGSVASAGAGHDTVKADDGDAARPELAAADAATSHPDCDERFEERFGTADEDEALRHRRGASASSQPPAEVEMAPAEPEPSGRGVAGLREVFCTWLLASLPCLAGNLDQITPIQTEFFLMLYLTVNVACFLQTFYYTPSFRPTWPVHWVVPAFGAAACLTLMFLVQWWQALAAIAIAAGLHQWVRYGQQVDEWGTWGASIASVTFGQASRALLALRDVSPTASNWRPQLLVLLSATEEGEPRRPELLALAAHLKKGKGVTMAATVRQGALADILDAAAGRGPGVDDVPDADATAAAFERCVTMPQRRLQERMAQAGVDGFAQLVAASDVFAALETAAQTSGLSALRPNSVLLGWPRDWTADSDRARAFVGLCKSVLRMRKSLVALRLEKGAAPLSQPQTGTIDLYWMGSDSGLILLLPYLLTRHRVWRGCRLRVFAVDPSMRDKADLLRQYLASVRIRAEVRVVPVDAEVIDQALQGRTLSPEAGARLAAQVRAAREDASPAEPLHAAASALEGQDARASTMTMVLGEGRAARLSGRQGRASVFDAFPGPKRAASAAKDPRLAKLADQAPRNGTAQARLGSPGAKADGKAGLPGDDDEDDTTHGDSAADAVGTALAEEGAEAADRSTLGSAGEAAASDEGPSPFVESAARLNAIIREHSKDASLVVASLMLSQHRDPVEFLQYTEQFCKGVPRAVLVRGSGNGVLTAVA